MRSSRFRRDAFRLIHRIKDAGRKVGIVLNPATSLSYISEYIHLIDKLTIMTVDPGFAGQSFITEMIDNIKQAKQLEIFNRETNLLHTV
ncbi:MAG: hypothetical protein ACI4XS_05005 [Bacillus sp. (in: firmicutes)]